MDRAVSHHAQSNGLLSGSEAGKILKQNRRTWRMSGSRYAMTKRRTRTGTLDREKRTRTRTYEYCVTELQVADVVVTEN